MATKPKHIIPVLGFRKMTDADLIVRATTICNEMTANTHFANPPVDLDMLKTTIANLAAAMSAALDGGRKEIAARNKIKDDLVSMLRQLAIYVETVSQYDMAVFASSGFQAVAPRTPAAPLTQPIITKIEYGTSGQVAVRISPIPKARLYEFRYAAMANNAPGAWTTVQLLSAKPYQVNELTPGTIYAFQVRALNKVGYTDWSDSITKMAV